MQSKITNFNLPNGEPANLFGNYDNLRPVTVHGVAHAFTNGGEAIVTLYSLTGMKEGGSQVCSADLRLSLNEQSLKSLVDQLNEVKHRLFPIASEDSHSMSSQTYDELEAKPKAKTEKLSAPL